MSGDTAVRHCDSCDESVHELSAMPEDEARAFVRDRGQEQPCIRYRFDAAGRILFAAALSMAVGGCMGKMPGSEAPCDPALEEPVASQQGEPDPALEGGEPAQDATSQAPAAAPASEEAP